MRKRGKGREVRGGEKGRRETGSSDGRGEEEGGRERPMS